MALIEQSYLQNLLNECDLYIGRQQKQSQQNVIARLDQIYKIFKRNIRQTFLSFSLDVIVRFAEIAVQIQDKFSYAQQIIQLFFERIQSPSQFFIRALLVKAKVTAYNGHKQNKKGQQIVKVLKQSISSVSKALDLITGPVENVGKGKDSKGGAGGDSSKGKYAFLVYNASTCIYKITRFMIRTYWQKNFTQIYERIQKLFEELDQPDHNWKSRFSLILFQCLYDNERKPDAFKVLDALWDKTKNKPCDFQDSLFRLRVHLSKQNNALVASIKKDIEGADPQGWKILQVLQRMKSGAIPEAQIEKQLMGVVNQISLGVLSTNEQTSNTLLSPIMQERLGQAGRIALKFNIISIASSIANFLAKVRQPNQKAIVLNQYNKAELMIKKKGEYIDKKTGMMMNATQIKNLEVQYRKESLKILEKVMQINKKLDNPQLIYEGSILIWNISLPFMCPQYQASIVKAFETSVSLLQQIDSVDHDLRTKMHLQLAKIHLGNELMFPQVQRNIMKAIRLDHSLPLPKIAHKFQPEQDSGLYYRPYQRYLEDFKNKILLKTLINLSPSELDTVNLDLWNVIQQKSQTTRIDILQKCLRTLLTLQEKQYQPDSNLMMVEEQIKQQKIRHQRTKLKDYKRKKLLTAEVAELAFEWQLNEFAKKACQYVLSDTWEGKNSVELIIAQAKCAYFLGQIKIDELSNENFQIPFQQCVRVNQEQEEKPLTQQKKQEVENQKKALFECYTKGLKLAESTQQHWLIFNGAIYLWNNFIHIFRNPINDSKLHKNLCQLLKSFFQAMKNSLKQIELKQIIYYDLDTKIQTFANIGLIYARLMEHQKQADQVSKICQSLLLTHLSPHTRKLINSIKARVNKGGAGKAPDNKKGGKQPQQKKGGYNDAFLFDIISQLQIIQNSTNKAETQNLIKKSFENLESWKPRQKDQTQLQLHAELWARLARLAINQDNINMYKYALRCVDYSLSYFQEKPELSSIPANRLRWYSLAQFLYAQSLLKISNPQTQQVQSYEKLLYGALEHAVEAAFKGFKSNINALVLDAAKQVWNICNKLQSSQKNRAKLMSPIKKTLTYLKEMKQQSQTDLILLLSQLYFKAAFQTNQFRIGEEVADMLFTLVPKNLQKSIWQAKMVFMSKQGKNELQAISNMKQADPSLQAKLWVKLARAASNPTKQHSAYNKAIDILKKQHSVQIVEVLVQYAQWQLRVGKQNVETVSSNLLLASDYLIDIQYGDQQEDEELQQNQGTVFSRSTRGKKSQTSKSMKSSFKQMNRSKKATEKKGPISGKSKGATSRMGRSNRVTKTIKSKNAKSIFSQKQEDPNPEHLNCSHYQRLFRIHTTLSMISGNPNQKIRYALDAKQFLLRIFQLSCKTLNDMQQNAAKFSQKEQSTINIKKQNMPLTIQDWVNLQLPKELLDKVKTTEDCNLMGAYVFDKPQLTFSYLKHLTQTFTNYGLDFHTIPIYFFQKFLAKEILSDQLLYNLSNSKLQLCLQRIKYSEIIMTQQQRKAALNFDKFSLTQAQKKRQLLKTNSHKVSDKNQNQLFQSISPPNIVKPFTAPEVWLQVAKTLLKFGQIYTAKEFAIQALKHFQILGSTQKIGEVYLCLTEIAELQGQFKNAVDYALQSNKFIRNSVNLQKLIVLVSRVLLKLNKFDDLNEFLKRVYEVVSTLIQQTYNERPQRSFQIEIVQLKNVLCMIQLISVNVIFIQINDNNIINENNNQSNIALLESAINRIQERTKLDPLWTIQHYETLLNITIQPIFRHYQEGQPGLELGPHIFKIFFKTLLKAESNMMELLKYTLIGDSSDKCMNYLTQVHRKTRFALVQGYVLLDNFSDKKLVENEQQIDDVPGMNSEPLKKYLKTLNMAIHNKIKPVPTNLQPLQAAIVILANLKTRLADDSYEKVMWLAQQSRAMTLRAISNNKLSHVWQKAKQQPLNESAVNANVSQAEPYQQNTQAAESLESVLNFMDIQEKVNNFVENLNCMSYAQRAYASLVQNTGVQVPQKFIEGLMKMQHASYSKKVYQNIRKYLGKNHKLISFFRFAEVIPLNKQKIGGMLSNSKIFDSLTNFPNYDECLSLLPRNSATIILQMNSNKTEMYFGCLITGKEQQQIKYVSKKQQVSRAELKQYLQMKQELQKIKKNMVVSPMQDDRKHEALIDQKQEKLVEIMGNFRRLSSWWLFEVSQIVNKQKQQQQKQEQIGNAKDKKAPPVAAKDKKKGGKDEVAVYESPLGASPSGIESVTFLLDSFLYSLPFEQLEQLQKVPAITRDLSFFYLSRKLKDMGFKPDLNNSNGFGADKGKYIAYDFKQQSLNFKNIYVQASKSLGNIKVQGLESSLRRPALGDYHKYLSQAGFLHVYGSIDFLNHMKFPNLLESIAGNKTKLLIISDHLNYRKTIINKFLPLEQNGQPIPLDEQQIALSCLLNLMNITYVKNRWASNPETMSRQVVKMYKSLGNGNYVGSIGRQMSEKRDKLYDRMATIVNGPAVLRM